MVGGSPQIPDGVIYFQSHCWVFDASVVADNADLDNADLSKYAKCDTPVSATGASRTGLPIRVNVGPFDSGPSFSTGVGSCPGGPPACVRNLGSQRQQSNCLPLG